MSRALAPALALGLALGLSGCAGLTASWPPWAESAARPAKLTGYLAANPIDGVALLGPPPAVDSPRGLADRASYLETRKLEGSPRWAQAISDNDLWSGGVLKSYGCAAGMTISPAATPALYRLMQRVELDGRTVSNPPKVFYNRTRPVIGSDLAVCLPRESWMQTNASYPSGHSLVGWAWALVLAELVPGRTDPVLATGRRIGDSRVVCGVHYQSDIEAGRTLASALVARLHSDAVFQADLAKARKEITKAPALRCAA